MNVNMRLNGDLEERFRRYLESELQQAEGPQRVTAHSVARYLLAQGLAVVEGQVKRQARKGR